MRAYRFSSKATNPGASSRAMLRGAIVTFALGAALSISAGCGEDEPSDEDAVLEVANEWSRAADSGNGPSACVLMTPEAQVAVRRPYAPIAPSGDNEIAGSCEEAVNESVRGVVAAAVDEQEFIRARVRGDAALALSGSGWCLPLLRADDGWLVSSVPLPGNEDVEIMGEEPCTVP